MRPLTGEGEKKGQDGDVAKTQTTATSAPPPVREKHVQKESRPPPQEGSGLNGEDKVKGGMDHVDIGKNRRMMLQKS
jgi:hypothetical protein